MTSFTRKLYAKDPAAAEAFRKASEFDHRLNYGKAVTLACFSPSAHGLRPVYRDVADWIKDNPNDGSGYPRRGGSR